MRAAESFQRRLLQIAREGFPQDCDHVANFVLIPKNNSLEGIREGHEVTALRPLTLKTTDEKLMAAAVTRSVQKELSKWTDSAQFGGVEDRNLVKAVIEMDSEARVCEILASTRNPCSGLC